AWVADDKLSGAKYLAVFNTADSSFEKAIVVSLKELGFSTTVTIKDMWTGKTVGKFNNEFAPVIKSHGAGLYKITKQ
ncbi:MAG: alpha-galactosidase, partial [Sphingobacteriales bacterium]|nr:alpha-galactosidase [Sphingobacteriales bacterium]